MVLGQDWSMEFRVKLSLLFSAHVLIKINIQARWASVRRRVKRKANQFRRSKCRQGKVAPIKSHKSHEFNQKSSQSRSALNTQFERGLKFLARSVFLSSWRLREGTPRFAPFVREYTKLIRELTWAKKIEIRIKRLGARTNQDYSNTIEKFMR